MALFSTGREARWELNLTHSLAGLKLHAQISLTSGQEQWRPWRKNPNDKNYDSFKRSTRKHTRPDPTSALHPADPRPPGRYLAEAKGDPGDVRSAGPLLGAVDLGGALRRTLLHAVPQVDKSAAAAARPRQREVGQRVLDLGGRRWAPSLGLVVHDGLGGVGLGGHLLLLSLLVELDGVLALEGVEVGQGLLQVHVDPSSATGVERRWLGRAIGRLQARVRSGVIRSHALPPGESQKNQEEEEEVWSDEAMEERTPDSPSFRLVSPLARVKRESPETSC